MSDSQSQTITLPATFSQVQLAGLKELVDHHHENEFIVFFDGSDIKRIDGAAVQFLLAAGKNNALTGNTDKVVKNANEVLQQAFEDMGILHLHDPVVSEATEDEASA